MTNTTFEYTRDNSKIDQYPHFSNAIKDRFKTFSNKPLFKTNAEGLFEAYLDALPEHARQHYNCRCCRHFIERVGGLVSIDEKGKISSILWDESETPEFFIDSVKAMKKIILKAKVTNVFLSNESILGTPNSNGWDHMSVKLPTSKVYNNPLLTAGQAMAEKKEDFRILIAGLLEYPVVAVDQAVTLLESESLYRSDRILGVAKFVQELHSKREKAKTVKARDNITWLAVATAPSGFCHIKSSMIGTLLDDIVSGLSVDSIQRRFKEKMSTYMRAQSAPSTGNINQAEKIVRDLGIEDSLDRRYATINEIPEFIWKGEEIKKKATAKSGGVFGNIVPKDKQSNVVDVMSLPTTVMTWDKFQRTVMPTADIVEVKVDNTSRLMALVTASNEDSPNILQWDNTFSWYYHGGIDGEIKRRVESAGGKYENNEIRCSLIWEGYTDLDLHCITPDNKHIYYSEKRADGRGYLDIDANGLDGKTMTPVENMRWSLGKALEGNFRFYVHNYSQHGYGSTPFKVELEVNGKIYTFTGSLSNHQKVTVFEFIYIEGQEPRLMNANSSYSSNDAWNVPTNSFVKVNGITNSPNQWGENKFPHIGQHVFFLLEGCKDLSEGKGRGFFVETLKPELREIRRTLEAHTANASIEDAEEATACGVGYSKDSGEWNLLVKVTTGNSTRLIKIDRWD